MADSRDIIICMKFSTVHAAIFSDNGDKRNLIKFQCSKLERVSHTDPHVHVLIGPI
jgi:hypothetical protein